MNTNWLHRIISHTPKPLTLDDFNNLTFEIADELACQIVEEIESDFPTTENTLQLQDAIHDFICDLENHDMRY